MSGFSIWLKLYLGRFVSSALLLNGLYAIVLVLIFYLLGFPLAFYEDFILEHRFGLSNERFSTYIKDSLKKLIISLILALIVIECLYLFLEKFTKVWWILAGAGWFFLTVILTKITPNIFIPLFYKYIPLKDVKLRDKIIKMFGDARTKLKDVYMIDFSSKTKKLNAAVVGFGKSRRVLLTDNLLRELSYEEILSIVAHELGHYKNRDTLKLIAFSAIINGTFFFLSDLILRRSFSFFGYSSIADIAGLPLFVLIMFILGFLGLPLQNGFSRHLETKADIYSISLSSQKIFISMMEKLAKENLAEVSPSKFIEIMFYTHPPIAKRIQLAKKL